MTRIAHAPASRTRKPRSATARLLTLLLAVLGLVASLAVPAQAATPPAGVKGASVAAGPAHSVGQVVPAAAKKVKRTVTLKASAAKVTVGKKVTFTGKVTHTPKGSGVRLQTKKSGKWVTVKSTHTTTKAGAFKVVVKVSKAGKGAYRAYAIKKGSLKAVVSKARAVKGVKAGSTTKTSTPVSGVRTAKALVLLTYSATHPVPSFSLTATREKFTQADAWLNAASYGKQRLTASITSWLKIPASSSQCTDAGTDTVMSQAQAAAKKAGYNISAYNEFIVYQPCKVTNSDDGELGEATLGGNTMWLFSGGLATWAIVHEFGHNLGLDHSAAWLCTDKNDSPVMYDGKKDCYNWDVGDASSPMGYVSFGDDYSLPDLWRLGWVNNSQVAVTTSGTYKLTTLATKNGVKGIVIPTVPGKSLKGRKYYSIEYRAGMKTRAFSPTQFEPQLTLRTVRGDGRYNGGDSTALQGMGALKPGMSWTTPEGERIQVLAMNDTTATIRLTPDYKPTVTTAPTGVTVDASDAAARVYWTAPANDGGMPITRYLITATNTATGAVTSSTVNAGLLPALDDPKLPPAKNTTTPTPGEHTALITGLTNGQPYTITIQAINQQGASTAVGSTVTPAAGLETVPNYERQALIDFYNTAGGSNWISAKGVPVTINDQPVCSWNWVACYWYVSTYGPVGQVSDKVTSIAVGPSATSAEISTLLKQLQFMENLDLPGNGCETLPADIKTQLSANSGNCGTSVTTMKDPAATS